MNARSERAQGAIEFALLCPVLLIVVLGIVDFSRFMYYRQALTTASRVGVDMAINHCSGPTSCGTADSPVADDYVLQATQCAAAPAVSLQPAASTCGPCLTTPCVSPCTASCLSAVCQADICINPLATIRTNGMNVTVSVGYAFQPITPLIGAFFPTTACWTGDPSSNHHTLCASYTAPVS